jgi:NodT family efflux transporter outer membrane factor (OMF) lipoprotein
MTARATAAAGTGTGVQVHRDRRMQRDRPMHRDCPMHRGRAILSATLAMVLLAGCAAGPDFHRPQPPAAARFTAEPLGLEARADASSTPANEQQIVTGAKPRDDWWRLFASPALDDVVQRALAGNATVAAAEATLAQMQALVEARAGAEYPQVGLTAGVGAQRYGAQFLGTQPKPSPFKYFSVGPAVSYALDYTGGTARGVERQQALADYQQQQVEAAYLAVSGNAVMEALRIASLRAQIAEAEAILADDRENLRLVQVAFDAGSVSRLDILTAQSQLANDTTLLPPLRQQLDLARHALAVVLGEPPASARLPDLDLDAVQLPHALPVGVPSELAHRRPDILASEAQLHAATAAAGIATANLYPQIVLTASTGQQATSLARLFDRASNVWSLAASLTAPLFDGGTLRAEQRAAFDAVRASTQSYRQAVLTAFGQVADALAALDHDAESVEALGRARAAAESALALTRASYQEGNVGVLQVLDAERQYQQARLGYLKAVAQRYLDTARLLLALGGQIPPPVSSAAQLAAPAASGRHSADR